MDIFLLHPSLVQTLQIMSRFWFYFSSSKHIEGLKIAVPEPSVTAFWHKGPSGKRRLRLFFCRKSIGLYLVSKGTRKKWGQSLSQKFSDIQLNVWTLKVQREFCEVTCLKQTFSESFMCLYLLKDNLELLIYVAFVKVRRDFNFSGIFFLPSFVIGRSAFKQAMFNSVTFCKRLVWWYIHDWVNN